MRKKFLIGLILSVSFLLGGCTQKPPETILPESTPTQSLASPQISKTQTPDIEKVAGEFLDRWKNEQYQEMYDLLSTDSKLAISQTEFVELYNKTAVELALDELDYEILSTYNDPQNAQVAVNVKYGSVLIEDLQRDVILKFILDSNLWRVNWSEQMIFPELDGDNELDLVRQVPARGNIYDQEGKIVVGPAEAISLGVTPAQIDPEQEEDMLNELSRALDIPAGALKAEYEPFGSRYQGYVPLGTVAREKVEGRLGILESYTNNGLLIRSFQGRYYFDQGIAPQAVGYVRWIQENEEDKYRRLGYARDEKVGGQGLEQWAEPYLSGKRGGTLYLVDSEGKIITQIANSQAGPADEVYTTFEKEFQRDVQQALHGYNGSIVVLEADTGRVLAMASNPSFDPNAFNHTNFNSNHQLPEYYSLEGSSPFLNRATQGLYPLGSVFKIITMAAGLESGEFQADDIYDCGYHFTEIQGIRLDDWTYDHYLEDGETPPSGKLTLVEGLMRSCNPYFWHIGLRFYEKGMTDAIMEMARGFGLGTPTGIEFLEEEAGNIPFPQSEVDATNLAVGQGQMQVTPLQVAQFIAALGNGGTIYRPQIVESIRSSAGEEVQGFTPEEVGELPISAETAQALQEGMNRVVENPRGTAYYRFRGLQIPLVGKTGTAESGSGEPHAWFAGYTLAENENKPDIAVVVIAENAGEGSEVAAPIFRRVVELYFDQYLRLYPWESEIGVWATPEPTKTPEDN
ncbi:MAG: penicillin-binding transpeptidase domain-containing protein [Anaerolineales bacterium]|nr:penicillin-binding transpeptidase domain-containing protein [Anaerolineales bacterium]